MIVGGYTLHLYCDGPPSGLVKSAGCYTQVGEFCGPYRLYAERAAREEGWLFYHEGGNRKVRCPACRQEGPR